MDWKYWAMLVPALVAAVYTVLGYYRDRPMSGDNVSTSRRSYAVMGILLLLTWGAVGVM